MYRTQMSACHSWYTYYPTYVVLTVDGISVPIALYPLSFFFSVGPPSAIYSKLTLHSAGVVRDVPNDLLMVYMPYLTTSFVAEQDTCRTDMHKLKPCRGHFVSSACAIGGCRLSPAVYSNATR